MRALLVMFFALVSSNLYGAEPIGVSREDHPLGLTLAVDARAHKLDEVVTLRVLLANNSKAPVYIFTPLDSRGIFVWAKTSTGRDIPRGSITGDLLPPPSSISKESFIKLDPSYIYGVTLEFKPSELGITAAGDYELFATYRSPIPRSMSFGLPVWSSTEGEIRSNEIVVSVSN